MSLSKDEDDLGRKKATDSSALGTRNPKRKFIKDPLWGSILLLSWERELIRNPLINRLHNIQQNSSAYKVYPALRVSRFAHSLGVMYVASAIFSNALQESVKGVLRSQSPEGTPVLEDEAESLKEFFLSEDLKAISSQVQIVAPLVSSDFRCIAPEFAHALAILRICALFHDVGHLPYSHVGEFAIERLAKEPPEGSSKEVATWESLLDKMRDQDKGKKVHEAFGKRLAGVIAEMHWTDHNTLIHSLIRAAEAVLHGPKYPILRSVVNSPIDADRIDFVRRDTHFSGLLNSSVDYTRLFAFFEVREFDSASLSQQGVKSFLIAPSRRAVSEIEKLLWERFQDYKYIVCHHRVHFNDELIERLIVELTGRGKIGRFVELVTGILGLPEASNPPGSQVGVLRINADRLLSMLTELDDCWLEMHLREQYVEIATAHSKDQLLWDLLVGYVENRKLFISGFKRDDDFWELAAEAGAFPKLGVRSQAQRASRISLLAEFINKQKYALEREISEQEGATIIIGDLGKKLSVGLSGPGAAQQLGLSTIYHFLLSKVAFTAPFNFWYTSTERPGFPELEGRRRRIFDFIHSRINPQLEAVA